MNPMFTPTSAAIVALFLLVFCGLIALVWHQTSVIGKMSLNSMLHAERNAREREEDFLRRVEKMTVDTRTAMQAHMQERLHQATVDATLQRDLTEPTPLEQVPPEDEVPARTEAEAIGP